MFPPLYLGRLVSLNVSSHSPPLFQGGSSGKGTALRGRSDADLVVFLSPLRSFQEQLDRRADFIREIRKQLEACEGEKELGMKLEVQSSKWENPRVLSFVLRLPWSHEGVEFDVLPAFDVLGKRPHSSPMRGLLSLSSHVSKQKSPRI